MEIKAKGKLDQQSISALAGFGIFKKYDYRKAILVLAAINLIPTIYTVVRLLILTRIEKTTDSHQMIMAMLPLLISTVVLTFPIRLMSYKAKMFNKQKNASFDYTFYDGSVSVICASIAGTKTFSIRYSELTMVGESSKNFFIYQGKNSYIVEKSTLENGTADHLRHRFSSMENIKYITCNY